MQISHSKIELFNTCGYKYYLQHVEKWSPDKTYTPLLFGSAIDNALNYVLECVRDNKQIDINEAKCIFLDKMKKWTGEKELVFFKNELPKDYDENGNLQQIVFDNLLNVGDKIIDTYITEIIPLFEKVEDVQIKMKIENEDDDLLILVMDFKAVLKDGRKVVFDNKTSSDIKKYYGKNSVRESNQLAMYTDYLPSDYQSGYIALSKKPDKHGKINWTMVVDKIPEEKTAEVFHDIETKTQMIKDGIFEKNEKSCYNFGRRCEFWDACKKNDYSGLIKR